MDGMMMLIIKGNPEMAQAAARDFGFQTTAVHRNVPQFAETALIVYYPSEKQGEALRTIRGWFAIETEALHGIGFPDGTLLSYNPL